jgi:hypothetical protein
LITRVVERNLSRIPSDAGQCRPAVTSASTPRELAADLSTQTRSRTTCTGSSDRWNASAKLRHWVGAAIRPHAPAALARAVDRPAPRLRCRVRSHSATLRRAALRSSRVTTSAATRSRRVDRGRRRRANPCARPEHFMSGRHCHHSWRAPGISGRRAPAQSWL